MQRSRMLLTAALPVAIVACDGLTGPPQLEVTISGPSAVSPYHGEYSNGAIRVQCDVSFTARAPSGDGISSATWTRGRMRWYDTSDGTLITTETVTAAEVAEIWGDTEIRPGENRTADWTFWAPRLFRVAMDFDYRTGKGTRQARYEFDCVPVAPGLSGRYRLSTIGDMPLPAYSIAGFKVHMNSIEFFAHNVTYRSDSRLSTDRLPPWDNEGAVVGYAVLAVDRFSVPMLIGGRRGR